MAACAGFPFFQPPDFPHMQRSDCIELGFISRAHGLNGEVRAILDVYDLSEYLDVKRLYLAKRNDPLRPYQVERLRVHQPAKGEGILQLAEVQDRNQAEVLKGTILFFPEAELPALEEGHFYYFEVIGYQVLDQTHGLLGTVQDFLDGAAQDLMVMSYQGREVLIPVRDEVVGLADHEQQVIHTSLPEGLLELYLGTDEEEGEE